MNLPISNFKSHQFVSYGLMGFFLLLVLKTGLLGALLAGLAIYACTQYISSHLKNHIDTPKIRQLSLAIVSFFIIAIVVLMSLWCVSLLSGNGTSMGVSALMLKMSEILGQVKQLLPGWMTNNWPTSVTHFNDWVILTLQNHASNLQTAGHDLIKGLTRIIIGMFIGGIISVIQIGENQSLKPFPAALKQRLEIFTVSFTQIVSAQFRISLINTLFTAIFLGLVLPLTGNALPFTKTMILITFIVGLIPVLGNLISNTIITVIALSVSLWVAISALIFLILIHKVEYFLNAKIIGGKIQAKAWELLVAMLLMEALFGLPGVIAAPIYYAYLKEELRKKEVI